MAASDYYDHSNYPTANSLGSSQAMRNEFDAVEAGFGKLPNLTGTNDWLVRVKADGTGLEAFSTFSDTTIANVSTSAHGLAPKLPGGTTSFLRGDGTWAPTTAAAILNVNRATNTALDVTNSGNCITYTAGFTQTIAAVATLPNGWFTYLRNASSATVTIDPNGAETIDGATTLSLRPNDSRLMLSDGSAFRTIPISGNPGRILLATLVPTAGSAIVNFLTTFSGLYDSYEIIIAGLVPTAANANLAINFAVGGVADVTGNYFNGQGGSTLTTSSGNIPVQGAGDNVGSLNAHIILTNANSGAGNKFYIANTFSRNVTNYNGISLQGSYINTGVVTGFRVSVSGSTLTAAGVISVYGLRKDI